MARAPRQPIDPTTSAPRGSPDISGTPAAPQIDPKSVTIAGQTLSPPGPSTDSPPNINQSWGPVPVLTDGMTFYEMGQTGLRQFSGWVREEFLQTLVGRQAAQKYREMRDNDPQIGGMMFAIEATMGKVEWRVEPADGSGAAQEKADFIDSCRSDMSSSWIETVTDHLSYLTYGFNFSELVYKKRNGRDPGMDPRPNYQGEELPKSDYDDGLIGWRRMPGRSQDTIIKWFFDRNGQTKGVTQQPWVGPLVDIPIEKSLLFRPVHYKSNPEGRSILRNAYTSFYYRKRLQEQEAILFERLGGVPVIYIPGQILAAANDGDPQAVAAVNLYKKIAINLRTDEQMGLVLPSDTYKNDAGWSNVQQYKFELVAPQMRAASINMDQTITRYATSMLTSVLADFLTLGHEARGTQSLAVTKVDMFMQAIEGYLNGMSQVYNKYAIARLFTLNGFDLDLAPKIAPDLAQRVDLDVLSNYVLRLAQAGMPLFPDEDIQTYLKDAAGLPDVDDSMALQAAGLLPEQLDREDDKQDAMLDNIQNPPAAGLGKPGARPGGPGGGSKGNGANRPGGASQAQQERDQKQQQSRKNLEAMLRKGIAQRMIRFAGPRFGVTTTRKRFSRRTVARGRQESR